MYRWRAYNAVRKMGLSGQHEMLPGAKAACFLAADQLGPGYVERCVIAENVHYRWNAQERCWKEFRRVSRSNAKATDPVTDTGTLSR